MPPPPPAPIAMVQAPQGERAVERREQQPTFLQLAGLAGGVTQMPVTGLLPLRPADAPPAPIILQQPPQQARQGDPR
eukprot:15374421-Alexandrium_andersonii.AAC.1